MLVVEDDQEISTLVARFLRSNAVRVSTASDGRDMDRVLKDGRIDLIVLDLMLPKMSGLEVCKILKSEPATRHIPILMLTARAEEIDRIVGLEFGADDYVTKPFSPREVTLRIRAILRRGEKPAETLQAGPISIDEPSTRFTVPSAFTLILQLEGLPMLNQKPTATPRPRLGPSSGAL